MRAPEAVAAGAAPPHSPRTGRAQRWLGRLHVTGVFWFRFHGWAVSHTPDWAPAVVIPVFVAFFFVTLRRIRRAVASNLEPVLGPCGWWSRQRRIHRTFRAFAWSQTERYERLNTSREFSWEIEGEENWRRLVEGSRGFVFLTAHVGNWEVGSMLPGREVDRRIHVVREAEADPRAQQYVRELLEARASERYTTHFESGDPALGVTLLEALRAGEIVAVQGDRPRAGGRSVEAEAFGRTLPLPVGPPALARAAGVPIAPVFVLREGRRHYRLRFGAPIDVERTRDRARDVERAARKIAAAVEEAIRQNPHQWFCFAPVWKPREVPRPKSAAGAR